MGNIDLTLQRAALKAALKIGDQTSLYIAEGATGYNTTSGVLSQGNEVSRSHAIVGIWQSLDEDSFQRKTGKSQSDPATEKAQFQMAVLDTSGSPLSFSVTLQGQIKRGRDGIYFNIRNFEPDAPDGTILSYLLYLEQA